MARSASAGGAASPSTRCVMAAAVLWLTRTSRSSAARAALLR
jgi:hypothetical protein